MQRVVKSFIMVMAFATPLAAQDANFLLPIDVIEQRIRSEPLVVLDVRGSRAVNDRTQTVVLRYGDGDAMRVKWAKAAFRGSEFNNEPRYEIAAYEIQKLFLDDADYVVPPTIARAVPVDWLKQYDPQAAVTFSGTTSVVLLIQYWLFDVSPDNLYDEKRFEEDTVYARHMGNFNILTHLIRHNDSNVGNFLVSTAGNGRVFAVDNGVAFRSQVSDRGFHWRDIRVKKLPQATIERLRQITREDLDNALGVVAHFNRVGDELVAGEPTANLGTGRGVRTSNEAVQFGLTSSEISGVFSRIQRLVERADQGRIQTF